MKRLKYRFEPTAAEQDKIRAEWGKRTIVDIARDLGVQDDVLSQFARYQMGLPSRLNTPLVRTWSEEDDAQILDAIRARKRAAEIALMFPERSLEAVKSRRLLLLRAMKDEAVARDLEERRQRFAAKPGPVFPRLKYDISECPRVSLAYAVRWAKQARRAWKQPADERQAWREINAMRLFGPIPVPPFLPAARTVPDDLPEWHVEAA